MLQGISVPTHMRDRWLPIDVDTEDGPSCVRVTQVSIKLCCLEKSLSSVPLVKRFYLSSYKCSHTSQDKAWVMARKDADHHNPAELSNMSEGHSVSACRFNAIRPIKYLVTRAQLRSGMEGGNAALSGYSPLGLCQNLRQDVFCSHSQILANPPGWGKLLPRAVHGGGKP